MADLEHFAWLHDDDRATLNGLIGASRAQRSSAPHPVEHAGIRIALAATAPIWLGATAAVVLARAVASPKHARPALVLHQRVGLAGRRLWIPKIPTMVVPQNRSAVGGLVALASGPPVDGEVRTALDLWLRRTGLDELPQLALIATGHMRLVGPRPVTPSELAEMRETGSVAVDDLAPGLLGVWQLLDRDAYSLGERRQLDHWMLEHWSARLRRRIVLTGLAQTLRRLVPS